MAPGTYELFAETSGARRMASFQMLTVDRDLNVSIAPGALPTVQFLFEDTAGHSLMMPDGSLIARRKDAATEGAAQPISTSETLLPGRWEVALAPDATFCVRSFEPSQSDGEPTDGRDFAGHRVA
ncbi:MAG: hypothetical protein WDO73_14450 [Ignavibacteriota bacterium]